MIGKGKPSKANLELDTRYFLDPTLGILVTASSKHAIPELSVPKKSNKLPLEAQRPLW